MELLPLVCLCLLSCSGETSAAGDGVRVDVEEDDDAVLPCSLSPKEDITVKTFEWRKDGQKEVFFYNSGIFTSQDEQFTGRVSHFQNQLKKGNASIKITKTKAADSGTYSCIFPNLQPRQTFNIELVVGQVLRDRTGEKSGAAPRPNISILHDTKDWALLQCKARGVPPLTVEWKDRAGNTLKNESILKSERRVTVNITVTKTDTYRCVATQKEINHQIYAETYVYIQDPPPEPGVKVVVEEGSDAVLSCSPSTKDITGQTFDWKKDESRQEVFFYNSGIFISQDEQFTGRVSHFPDQLKNGDASIKIRKTKMADSGTYSCDFPRLQPRQTFIIELVVGVRVVVKEDDDAVLPCSLSIKEDITRTAFDWKKDGQEQVYFYDPAGHTSQGQQFKGRVSHFQDQLKNGNASMKITKTKMADSGTYSCNFPHLQPRQTFYIELVVGAAPRPYIDTLHVTKDWALLQCEAHGVPPLTVEWKDSAGNTLHADEPQISERGGRSYITVKTIVTKTDNYRCVATQEEISHQIFAETYVSLQDAAPEPGSSAGWIFGGVSVSLVSVAAVLAGLYINNRKKNEIRQLRSQLSSATPLNPTDPEK